MEAKTNKALWAKTKNAHPDALILMRGEDSHAHYFTYSEDANACGEILKREETDYICFSYHALDIYLPKLVRAGRRVAIIDLID